MLYIVDRCRVIDIGLGARIRVGLREGLGVCVCVVEEGVLVGSHVAGCGLGLGMKGYGDIELQCK
jgi:hypothetical protein